LHVYFMYLEMVAWDQPLGMKTFRTTQEFATASKGLAANQGLYNGFLAVGLLWSLSPSTAGYAMALQLFFLGCVLTAAIFGAATAKRSILFIQGGPAALALAAVLTDAAR